MALTVRGLVERMGEALALTVLGSPEGLSREIPTSDASGPGLVLAGYTGRFVHQRVQVLGETEITYLQSLDLDTRRQNLRTYFSYPIPCVMVTKGQSLPEGMDEEAHRAGVSVLISALNTREFYRVITPFLESEFSPAISLHGSLADVFGVGLLFTGESGIGKSECVLDLVERGHRLVADDLVLARRKGADVVIGRGHELQRHYMEIRGVGLIDVSAIFGIHSVRQQKRIEVVVDLVVWDKTLQVDRTGLDTQTVNILGVDLPKITVPLNPGKNITVIAEVIAMNHLLRYTGVDAAQAFNERLKARMVRRAGDVRKYLLDDDE
ncbi:MAG: HPr(Ser) kinase/phosphatase [Gemmatimonadaceae bacterium]|jgi:HPr kinase/phosphorylase|nr:HPr(Ser) kinase/phosphatase [Gemmatimonadaceae bacterium]